MLGLIGISFKSAAISIREQYAFSSEEIEKFSRILQNNVNHKGVVVISTCNRTEIYFHSRKRHEKDAFDLILGALTTLKNYSDEHRPSFYFKSGKEVAEHLFKVTAGIDSLVIGEDQIIGQVKSAYTTAQEINSCDTILSRLFTKAFEAGKKVRSTTTINQGSASVSSAAVDLCLKNFPNLSKHTVFVIGAGQTGQLVLTSLGKRQIKSLYVANRTVEKAESLADKYNGIGIGLDEIEEYLPKSDVVIVATDSQNYLLNKAMMAKVKSLRKNADNQLFIDLSVPRNIDPAIASIEGVNLYAVDDLTQIVNSTTQKRTEAVDDAMKIIDEVSEDFMEWLVVRGLSPIFAKIKTNFQQIHQSEIEGFVKVNGITDHAKVEEYGRHISDKYARLFIRNLRSMAKNGESKDSIEAINELFEL
ncbi:MAG: glutamyl-tRNA reductase [Bacteroidales bacterium]|nr:glutamyl-tRNA reductase [Bacteroidales bacterium]